MPRECAKSQAFFASLPILDLKPGTRLNVGVQRNRLRRLRRGIPLFFPFVQWHSKVSEALHDKSLNARMFEREIVS